MDLAYRILQREDENFLVVLPQHSDPKSIKEQ